MVEFSKILKNVRKEEFHETAMPAFKESGPGRVQAKEGVVPLPPYCLETPESADYAMDTSEASALYEKMLALTKQIFHRDVDFEKIHTEQTVEIVTKVTGAIVGGNEKIIELPIFSEEFKGQK